MKNLSKSLVKKIKNSYYPSLTINDKYDSVWTTEYRFENDKIYSRDFTRDRKTMSIETFVYSSEGEYLYRLCNTTSFTYL